MKSKIKNRNLVRSFIFYKRIFLLENSESHRILLSNVVLHCCDFSGNVKPFPIARIWSERINREFTKQVNKDQHSKKKKNVFSFSTIKKMN